MEKHLDPEDLVNIEDAIFNLNAHLSGNPILNIHLLFCDEQRTKYIGTWICMKDVSHLGGSYLIWIFLDEEWNHVISEESILPIFQYISKKITNTFYYDMYGNFNNWQLARSGKMIIRR